MKLCTCANCGEQKQYYAKGLCRVCYTRARNHGFTLPELKKWDRDKKRKTQNIRKRERDRVDRINAVKITTGNEFNFPQRSRVTCKVIDWYYNSTDKYLIFDCGDDTKMRASIYNNIYSITKRRHNINVNRYCRDGKVIVERKAA